MTRGKSLIPAFTSSSPRQPMEPVGQDRSACSARRRSALATGWALTKDVSAASPKTEGAICRHASQSMQVESTKKSPGTFSGTRFRGFAMIQPPCYFTRAGGRPDRKPVRSLGEKRFLAGISNMPALDYRAVGQLVGLHAPVGENVLHRDPLRQQEVADQPSMTPPE